MKTLSMGCGKSEAKTDVIRLDISKETGADVVWDLNVTPYPFNDSSFTRIECFDVIEHLENIPKVMQECFRILQKDGVMYVTTPHYSSPNSYVDPTHRFHLSLFSFDCFSDAHKYHYYSGARFKIEKRLLTFQGPRLRKALLTKLANKYPQFYESHIAWIFPAWFMYFELKALK